jgi:tetratricopeptide (TPR) repeat protein
MRDKAGSSDFLIATLDKRDRKVRLVVMTAGAVAVALVVALSIGSVRAGLAASRERTMANAAKAQQDSVATVIMTAEWDYLRALAVDEKELGPKHPDVARDLSALATLYSAAGRYLEAEQLMRRALAIDGRRFGQMHPKVAGDLFALAGLYRKMGRSADAESLYKLAQGIYANLGRQYPGD